MQHYQLLALSMMPTAVISTGCTTGQHQHTHGASLSTQSSSFYAGQQTRTIKALSAQEEQDLRQGKGMGLAKAAELNGYPGPMHTLELARAMQLTEAQKSSTMALMTAHKATVKALGEKLIEAERHLDRLFFEKAVTPESIDIHTENIGKIQAQIRAEHLRTHLEQTALLSREQVAKYNSLRGYTN